MLPAKPSHYSPRMEALAWLAVVVAGYLPGSLPAGFLAGRLKGVDIRTVGSGNIGATNAFRMLGKGIGTVVLLIDLLKGLLPCLFFPTLFAGFFPDGQLETTLQLLIGVSAILGHNYPCWLGFKGGKGIATTAGVVGALAPVSLGICLGTWIVFFAVSRYVSVASIAAAVALPVSVAALPGEGVDRFGLLFWIFLLLGAMAIWKHRLNIQRLMNGTEHRAWGGQKTCN
ncbi:MAG: glycerol-3-phosphate 1-O-acyltransferase PlsY [Verrucomicrobiota bacterium]|nr:glycerol-3-phosphate 1-O-acyltransferase PlsY [Verrucomicrobiota bacterium]MDP7290971.1 glycerol-3-phosphate 1-O-acyltransferase PlsY [Verrucomicrobiota bacterium]